VEYEVVDSLDLATRRLGIVLHPYIHARINHAHFFSADSGSESFNRITPEFCPPINVGELLPIYRLTSTNDVVDVHQTSLTTPGNRAQDFLQCL